MAEITPISIGNDRKLSDRQLKALPLILQGRSIKQGCKLAKISPDTFYEWQKDPLFRSEFDRHQREMIREAFDSLKASGREAVEVLTSLLRSGNENIQFRTAIAILETITKAIELEDIEKRIEHLERQVLK